MKWVSKYNKLQNVKEVTANRVFIWLNHYSVEKVVAGLTSYEGKRMVLVYFKGFDYGYGYSKPT